MALDLVNTHTAVVTAISEGQAELVTEDGRELTLSAGTPALSHADYAFNTTVHAFQGRTVDQAIAVLAAGHTELTTQKTFYVEVSRARDRLVLVTDNTEQLAETLSWNTGERVSALAGIAQDVRSDSGADLAHQLADAVETARREIEYGLSLEEFEAMHADAPGWSDDEAGKGQEYAADGAEGRER